MNLDAAIVRTLGVLQQRLPAMLDTVQAETAAIVVSCGTAGDFVPNASEHRLSVNGTIYGPVSAATQQAALLALSALIAAGVTDWAAYVIGTGVAARLHIAPGPVVLAMPVTVVTTETYADQLGELKDPASYIRGTDDMPELDYPAVLVHCEGSVDVERYVTDHDRREYPLAIEVRGFERDTETLADRVAWCYANAVKRVVHQGLAGGNVIHYVAIESVGPPEAWGEGAHGRAIVVRVAAHQYGVPFAS